MAPPSARSETSSLLQFVVSPKDQGQRLDQFLAARTEYSRARLSRWLKAGQVLVNDQYRPASYRVRNGDRVQLKVPPPEASPLAPEPLPLDILYEDQDLILLNKPAGLVVHPAPGHRGGTLLNALLAYFPELAGVGDLSRPGLVHRLDKDTSGVLVVAKTSGAHANLVRQFQTREVEKLYLALVWGWFDQPVGTIDREVGRHPTQRQKMSAHSRRGRSAVTHWRVLREYPGPLTLVELSPKTGRTHQLRVHLAALGHPVLGDATYGGGAARLKKSPFLEGLRPLVSRQLLHAHILRVNHPRNNSRLSAEAPLPQDFAAVLEYLEKLE
jgi:23S rRNA pseudouridine1911/1915/1917 synthase|uniref:Pseudouridine synthase n=1 Tax=Desulfobacca acetoxidans TaxID=60893 RepID=A0A7C5ELA2_9BACT